MSEKPFVPVIHGASADRPDEADTLLTAEAVRAALCRLGYRSEVIDIGADPIAGAEALAAAPTYAVFNLVEAIGGHDAPAAEVPAELDVHGLAYTGVGTTAWQATLSKPAAKRALAGAGLPVPNDSLTGEGFADADLVIVKSLTEHASLGIDAASVVRGAAARRTICERQARFGGRFFAEAYVDGREFNVSVLETSQGLAVLPLAEIDFSAFPSGKPRIVDYAAKWDDTSFAYSNTPRRFQFAFSDELLIGRLESLALAACKLFGVTGYARVDFRVDRAGDPYILEVNPNPCLAPDAGFAAAAAEAGLSFDDLVTAVLAAAKRRTAGAPGDVSHP